MNFFGKIYNNSIVFISCCIWCFVGLFAWIPFIMGEYANFPLAMGILISALVCGVIIKIAEEQSNSGMHEEALDRIRAKFKDDPEEMKKRIDQYNRLF